MLLLLSLPYSLNTAVFREHGRYSSGDSWTPYIKSYKVNPKLGEMWMWLGLSWNFSENDFLALLFPGPFFQISCKGKKERERRIQLGSLTSRVTLLNWYVGQLNQGWGTFPVQGQRSFMGTLPGWCLWWAVWEANVGGGRGKSGWGNKETKCTGSYILTKWKPEVSTDRYISPSMQARIQGGISTRQKLLRWAFCRTTGGYGLGEGRWPGRIVRVR